MLQILVLSQMKGSPNTAVAKREKGQLKGVFFELLHNKKFLGYVGVALFFYATWHLDWTLYFIGEANYLKLDEAWISYVNILLYDIGDIIQCVYAHGWRSDVYKIRRKSGRFTDYLRDNFCT